VGTVLLVVIATFARVGYKSQQISERSLLHLSYNKFAVDSGNVFSSQSVITSSRNILLLRPNNRLDLLSDLRPTRPGAGGVLETESVGELGVVYLDCILVAVRDGVEEHAQLALGERGEGAGGGGGVGLGSHGLGGVGVCV
jgi:hypothetical protein